MSSKVAVLVTGASSGIGKATVELLSARGIHVIAAVKTKQECQMWEGKSHVTVTCFDVRNRAELDEFAQWLKQENFNLNGVFNIAGISCWGPIVEISDQAFRDVWEINVLGIRNVTQTCLPFLTTDATIVNIGSTAGKVAIAFMGAYAMAKRAVSAYTDLLRREFKVSEKYKGIRIVLVEPGSVATPIWDKALHAEYFDRTTELGSLIYPIGVHTIHDEVKNSPGPEVVAKLLLKILHSSSPRRSYLVGRGARFMTVLSWLPAAWVDALMVVIKIKITNQLKLQSKGRG